MRKINRVCHMTSVHATSDVRIFSKECRSLAKAGYEVYLVGADGVTVDIDGVKIRSIETCFKNRLERMFKVASQVYQQALKIDADVYHIHDPELLQYALRLKKRGKKVIYDAHEDYPSQISDKVWIPKKLRKIISRTFLMYEKRVCSRMDAVISVTPHIVERLKQYNENTYMITNYPILKMGEEVQRNLGGKSIIFAGGISQQWMHENIIEAIRNLEGIKYSLIGGGEKDYINKLKELDVNGKVEWIGKVPYIEVHQKLRQAMVGVALNDYVANVGTRVGSLGNTKLFEYMEAGIPVICTDFILWKEIVEKENCGLCVNPKNIEEITSAIKYLLENTKQVEKMGANGMRAVRERYNWSTQEKILVGVYNQILK